MAKAKRDSKGRFLKGKKAHGGHSKKKHGSKKKHHKPAHMVKGSKAAKAHMSRLRAMQGKAHGGKKKTHAGKKATSKSNGRHKKLHGAAAAAHAKKIAKAKYVNPFAFLSGFQAGAPVVGKRKHYGQKAADRLARMKRRHSPIEID